MVAYVGNDFPTTLPITLEVVEMSFYDSVRYSVHGNDSQQEWVSTDPRSQGFVRLGPEARAFSVSMFHQLHCLMAINRALLGTQEESQEAYGHVQHCLQYLRQFFMCAADTTLEPGDFLQLPFGRNKEGVLFDRECKDWSAVYSFADENHVAFRQYRTDRTRKI